MRKKCLTKADGNVLDFITGMITILAISVIVMVSFSYTELLNKKLEVSQIARRYILQMETRGYLESMSEQQLYEDLQRVGMKNIDLSGTTRQSVVYGEKIMLCISGELEGIMLKGNFWTSGFGKTRYHVEEKRMSTAKN